MAAVLGSPIAHSLSPALHTAAYRELGLSGWSYQAIECDEAGLPGLLDSLGPDWAGLSLTMPLKRAVLPLLDRADPLVTDVGAANTVLLAYGSRAGYNTDVPGMVTALAEAGAGVGPADRASTGPADRAGTGPGDRRGVGHPFRAGTGTADRAGTGPGDRRGVGHSDRAVIGPTDEPSVLILGGGATACSAIAALHRAGAQAVTAAVRHPEAAAPLQAVAGRLGLRLSLVAFEPGPARSEWLAGQHGRRWPLLLSTVPAGAAESYAGLVAAGALSAAAVFDVVYHPWPTAMAAAAAAAGIPVVSGFDLLLHQAAGQVELMTGRQPPVAAMRAAGQAALAARY